MVTEGIVKTAKRIGIADEYDEVIGRHFTFDMKAFSEKAIFVYDDDRFLSIDFHLQNPVVLISLVDTAFYEKVLGMSLDELIDEMERIASGPAMGDMQGSTYVEPE